MWKCKKCGNTGFKKEYDVTKTEYDLVFNKEGELIDYDTDLLEDVVLVCDECGKFTRTDDIMNIADWVEE